MVITTGALQSDDGVLDDVWKRLGADLGWPVEVVQKKLSKPCTAQIMSAAASATGVPGAMSDHLINIYVRRQSNATTSLLAGLRAWMSKMRELRELNAFMRQLPGVVPLPLSLSLSAEMQKLPPRTPSARTIPEEIRRAIAVIRGKQSPATADEEAQQHALRQWEHEYEKRWTELDALENTLQAAAKKWRTAPPNAWETYFGMNESGLPRREALVALSPQ